MSTSLGLADALVTMNKQIVIVIVNAKNMPDWCVHLFSSGENSRIFCRYGKRNFSSFRTVGTKTQSNSISYHAVRVQHKLHFEKKRTKV